MCIMMIYMYHSIKFLGKLSVLYLKDTKLLFFFKVISILLNPKHKSVPGGSANKCSAIFKRLFKSSILLFSS